MYQLVVSANSVQVVTQSSSSLNFTVNELQSGTTYLLAVKAIKETSYGMFESAVTSISRATSKAYLKYSFAISIPCFLINL